MKHFAISILFIVISLGSLLATGPSSIHSELTPIARNSKGDVLCKTRYLENQTGGYGYLDVYYGLCVLTKKKIIEYPVFKLDAQYYENMDREQGNDNSHLYWLLRERWDSWFTNEEASDITRQETDLVRKYAFDDFDMVKYQVSDTISIGSFQKKYNTDLSSKKLKTLRKAHSFAPESDVENIIVSYVFDNKLICSSIDVEDLRYAPTYNYKTNLFGGIPYDFVYVDGVLFR